MIFLNTLSKIATFGLTIGTSLFLAAFLFQYPPIPNTHASSQSCQQGAHTAELAKEYVPYELSMGSDSTKLSAEGSVSELIQVDGAPWLRLDFGDVNLGNNSYIEITSIEDAATQVLTTNTIKQWQNESAYFNGDAVTINVVIAPEDRNILVDISGVVAGISPRRQSISPKELDTPITESICGVDNRTASNERRVARIDPIGCTAWTIGNGKLLTAGHCLAGGSRNRTISFNPPASASDGSVRFPPPEDQYSIIQDSFVFADNGPGDDWGVFRVRDNSETGDQPRDDRGFFRRQRTLSAQNIRITGFGVDSGTTNQTNQTHVGTNTGSSGTRLRYNADTNGGNSGSPVINEANGRAIGIHTHGGCEQGGNQGTSLNNTALRRAIRQR